MKDNLIILLWCIAVLAIILFVSVGYIPQYEPEDGIWLCEELQIQLDYSGTRDTFVINNGEKIHCSCGSDRGVKAIQVVCQQRDHPTYDLGEIIFYAEIKKIKDNTLIVRDPTTEQEYTFVRINH